MTSPFFQGVNPPTTPDPVTPSEGVDETKGGVGYAGIPPAGAGPAPYDISAPQDIAGITAAVSAAGALSAGVENDLYPSSPRQAESKALLESPQGAPAMNVFAGFPDYENQDLRPSGDVNGPIQGTGTPGVPLSAQDGSSPPSAYPGTTQDGITQFTAGLGAGVEGVPPEGGNLGAGGGDYPGTTQSGLQTYGTS